MITRYEMLLFEPDWLWGKKCMEARLWYLSPDAVRRSYAVNKAVSFDATNFV